MMDVANELFAERGYEEVSVADIARAAGITRGLVFHYFGGRTEVYVALLERLGSVREEHLHPPVGSSARQGDELRWLDWSEANRTIYLGTLAPGEDIAAPEVRQVIADLRGRTVAARDLPRRIAQDTPKLRYALECWTGLNRAATRRWLRGAATREATQEGTRLHARTRPAHVRSAAPGERADTSTEAVPQAISGCWLRGSPAQTTSPNPWRGPSYRPGPPAEHLRRLPRTMHHREFDAG